MISSKEGIRGAPGAAAPGAGAAAGPAGAPDANAAGVPGVPSAGVGVPSPGVADDGGAAGGANGILFAPPRRLDFPLRFPTYRLVLLLLAPLLAPLTLPPVIMEVDKLNFGSLAATCA